MAIKNMSDEDKALMYGIVGGTPQYLLQMSDKRMEKAEKMGDVILNSNH